jgi:hypothetical protein
MPFVDTGVSIEVRLELPIERLRPHFALHRVMMETTNGGTTLKCARSNLEPFAAMLLTLGCSVVVRQPPELVETFDRLAAPAAGPAASGRSIGLGSGL